ncbi:MAG: DUF2752 domain-containing protein [Bacteroidetes bacterium]|nr:DUF2752 domain-containing protein [Bacteroidota bacterium]MBM3424508.1 DUF2752 domain-containing protein [Bacteroidota bacterium]
MKFLETKSPNRRRFKVILFSAIALILVVLYGLVDPETSHIFPKCPLKTLTNYDCPGCGSQRAVHALLNLEFREAFRQNALLVIALPYLGLGVVVNIIKNPSKKVMRWRELLFGYYATFVVLGVVLAFAVFRNIN